MWLIRRGICLGERRKYGVQLLFSWYVQKYNEQYGDILQILSEGNNIFYRKQLMKSQKVDGIYFK